MLNDFVNKLGANHQPFKVRAGLVPRHDEEVATFLQHLRSRDDGSIGTLVADGSFVRVPVGGGILRHWLARLIDPTVELNTLWLDGPPGTGKSLLAHGIRYVFADDEERFALSDGEDDLEVGVNLKPVFWQDTDTIRPRFVRDVVTVNGSNRPCDDDVVVSFHNPELPPWLKMLGHDRRGHPFGRLDLNGCAVIAQHILSIIETWRETGGVL